jgi:DNA phosphorothioation-dependent restriction protein DptH
MVHTSSEEEIRRVLLHGVQDEQDTGRSITNLLSGEWGEQTETLVHELKKLAESYGRFVLKAAQNGLFNALFSDTESPWRGQLGLRNAYEQVFDHVDIQSSALAGLLCRAFLIIRRRPPAWGNSWYADCYEEAAVATVLHPAVVEMFEAQAIYLTSCFNYAVNHALGNQPDKTSFPSHVWKTYVDLADIQAPLPGLLENEQLNLNANVRGQELIHVLGSPKEKDAPLSTRLLLKYDEAGEDEKSLSDSELFRQNSESRLIQRLLLEYLDLHPHARDSLSIAIYRNRNIQPVIAAVHNYLKILATKPTDGKKNPRYVLHQNRTRPYAISITLFTESNDEADVARWVNEWRERWEAAETERRYELYRLCRFSLAHRIIDGQANDAFQRLLNEQFEADVAFFCDFISTSSGVCSFEKVEPFNVLSRKLKFPILEKSCCTVDNPAERYRRRRIVSNRQFTLGERYANLLHSLQTRSSQKGSIVVGTGDFTPWRGVIDTMHKNVEWVICIDPNMDEGLIKTPQIENHKKREIIGFGSGVGSHGEDNYTISTERFSFTDIHLRLKEAIHSLYGSNANWSQSDCETVAGNVLGMAPQLSGLSLVRATGVGDQHIRDFMAYAITRKLLPASSSLLCDCLISLDAYRHWFDLAENRRQPDLLHLQAGLDEKNRLAINMHLVECKLADQVDKYIDKARSQINNGLKVLTAAFVPLSEQDSSGLEDDYPDRRFWWMQLHRLIASKTKVDKSEYPKVLTALERLAEGEFVISWKASIFAFQVDEGKTIECLGYWSPDAISCSHAYAFLVGGEFVRKLFVENDETDIDWESLLSKGKELALDYRGDDMEEEPGDIPWNDGDTDEDDEYNELCEEDNDPCPVLDPAKGKIMSPERGDDSSRIGIVDPNEPDTETILRKVFLGKTIKGDQPVYWEFFHPELVNRHLLIFGSSGQGKTYAIQCLLCEMSRFRQNSLIIDYTNGFLPNQLENVTKEMLQPQQHVIKNDPLPINPFIPQKADNGGIIFQENANDIAKRIAGLFDSVYQIGDQQYSVLHRAIMDGVGALGRKMDLDQMLTIIESLADEKRFKASAQSLHNKLRPFVLDRPFRSGEEGVDWEYLFSKQKPFCNIFQLAGMDERSSRLITEFILWDLYGYLQAKGQKSDPKVVVLDEVQNLDHKEGSPLSKYLREGRKFGLSLILATQTMSNMKKDERDRMFQADHKLFFKPADTELKAFADIASLATQQRVDDWVQRLSSLAKGECYSIGKALAPNGNGLVSRVHKIRITALEKRSLSV